MTPRLRTLRAHFQTVVNWAMCVVFALAFACAGTVAYWLLAPYNVLATDSDVLTLESSVVRAGSLLKYRRSWCKYTDAPGTVSREFVDGFSYPMPAVPTTAPRGCGNTTVSISVPLNLSPGIYRLHQIVTYFVNLLRRKTYDFWSTPFRVEGWMPPLPQPTPPPVPPIVTIWEPSVTLPAFGPRHSVQ